LIVLIVADFEKFLTGADSAIMANHWAEGGAGAKELAEAVVSACASAKKEDFKFLYDVKSSIKDKIATIATEMYGAKSVSYSAEADAAIARYTANGNPRCAIKGEG
jgi:formyltetrahydrofolate synthetase